MTAPTQKPANRERYERALVSLEGLSVGDAFGERLFIASPLLVRVLEKRIVTAGPWGYTDDTQMALSIVSELRQRGRIDQDALARSFARHYAPNRGYGPGMHHVLAWIRTEMPWRVAARKLFDGRGSWGNGAAMRVAPLGAYFADDLARTAEEARLSAEVTHGNPEAAAGAIAVAVAAALAWQLRDGPPPERPNLLEQILSYVPESLVRAGVERARDLPPGQDVRTVTETLGNGTQVSAQDTVPFVLWCATEQLGSYEEALWLTVSGLGDRDTTCAMVGGIVAMYVGMEGLPEAWRIAREPLPIWPFEEVVTAPTS